MKARKLSLYDVRKIPPNLLNFDYVKDILYDPPNKIVTLVYKSGSTLSLGDINAGIADSITNVFMTASGELIFEFEHGQSINIGSVMSDVNVVNNGYNSGTGLLSNSSGGEYKQLGSTDSNITVSSDTTGLDLETNMSAIDIVDIDLGQSFDVDNFAWITGGSLSVTSNLTISNIWHRALLDNIKVNNLGLSIIDSTITLAPGTYYIEGFTSNHRGHGSVSSIIDASTGSTIIVGTSVTNYNASDSTLVQSPISGYFGIDIDTPIELSYMFSDHNASTYAGFPSVLTDDAGLKIWKVSDFNVIPVPIDPLEGLLRIDRYLCVQELVSGQSGRLYNTNHRHLSNIIVNNLGLAINELGDISIPPGKYYISAWDSTFNAGNGNLKIVDSDTNELILGGITTVGGSTSESTTTSKIYGTINILTERNIRLVHSVDSVGYVGNDGRGKGPLHSNAYAQLEIWNLDPPPYMAITDSSGTTTYQMSDLITGIPLTTYGDYEITFLSDILIDFKVWGAAGGCMAGGSGGYVRGSFSCTKGDILVARVGQGGTTGNVDKRGANGGFSGGGRCGMTSNSGVSAGSGGGLTGVFLSSVNHANSLLIAGSGGGGKNNYSNGGHGAYPNGGYGAAAGAAGGGAPGTQSSGGARGKEPSSYAAGGSGGSALVGGNGASSVTRNFSGSGGGAGYYGGGGGGGNFTSGGAGGGGSSYYHPTLISNASTMTAPARRIAPNSSDPDYINGHAMPTSSAAVYAESGGGLIVMRLA